MANKEKGEVSLSIDGKEYILKLTANSLAVAESLSGVGSLFDMDNLGFSTVRALFFASARGQIDSINAAGEMMDTHFEAIVDATTEAYALFFQRQVNHIT